MTPGGPRVGASAATLRPGSDTTTAGLAQTRSSHHAPPSPRPDLLSPRGPWPLTLFFVGFPLFWALGLGTFALPMMSVPMLWELRRRRPLLLPRRFGIWVLFLLWSLAGILVLGVDPQGTLPDSASSRLLGYGLRELSYVSVTVALLYVVNLGERELPNDRLCRLLGWLFVWTVLGGVLAMAAPTLSFTSPFEMVLPRSLTGNLYVQHLVHPASAQVQELLGGSTPRPAAPFGYTNTWGFHVTLLAPFFFLGWVRPARGLRRVACVAVLAIGALTLVFSLNRAAWIASVLMLAFVAVRLVMRGRLVPVVGLSLLAVVLGAVLLASPLHTVVQERFADGKSNDIRTFTTQRAVELSARSPVIGYGSTRSTLGSASSIVVGKSEDCPQCGNVSIGINGYVYLLLMSTGYVGTAMFFAFWLSQLWQARGDRSAYVLVAGLTVAIAIFYGFFYDVSTWLLVPFMALAVLARAHLRPAGPGVGRPV